MYNIGKIKDIKFKTEMLYSLMPERRHITKNRINAESCGERQLPIHC